MRRGEIWTVSGGPDYTGKPRPALIVQDDRFATMLSVTTCGLTTVSTNAPFLRPRIDPATANGLLAPSYVMIDKVTTLPLTRLGKRIGHVTPELQRLIDRALSVFLGLAG